MPIALSSRDNFTHFFTEYFSYTVLSKMKPLKMLEPAVHTECSQLSALFCQLQLHVTVVIHIVVRELLGSIKPGLQFQDGGCGMQCALDVLARFCSLALLHSPSWEVRAIHVAEPVSRFISFILLVYYIHFMPSLQNLIELIFQEKGPPFQFLHSSWNIGFYMQLYGHPFQFHDTSENVHILFNYSLYGLSFLPQNQLWCFCDLLNVIFHKAHIVSYLLTLD